MIPYKKTQEEKYNPLNEGNCVSILFRPWYLSISLSNKIVKLKESRHFIQMFRKK